MFQSPYPRFRFVFFLDESDGANDTDDAFRSVDIRSVLDEIFANLAALFPRYLLLFPPPDIAAEKWGHGGFALYLARLIIAIHVSNCIGVAAMGNERFYGIGMAHLSGEDGWREILHAFSMVVLVIAGIAALDDVPEFVECRGGMGIRYVCSSDS